MFFVAYRVASKTPRPVTFIWNGGPGSPATLLHFEAFGPRRIEGGRFIDNPASLLVAVTLGSGLGLWRLSVLSEDLVRASALEGAAQQSAMLDEVNRAKPAEGPEYQRYHNLVEGLCIAAGLPKEFPTTIWT